MAITLRPSDKLAIIANLATMLGAGISILEAIETMQEDSKGPTGKVLQKLHDSLNEGKPVSYAFEQMPGVFDPVTINLTKAAEEAGTLEETLHGLAIGIEKEMEFTSKLRANLTYPLFVLGVFVLVVTVILVFVIPRIAKVFGGLGINLPEVTQLIITISNGFLVGWPFIVGGVVGLCFLLSILYKTQRRLMINALLNMPGLRKLGRQIDLARFTRSLGLLLRAGLPIAEALELAEKTVVKKEIVLMLQTTQQSVLAGKPFAEGLKRHRKIVPATMLRTVEAAENSGTLEETMIELGTYFETQVDKQLRTITALIEPIMVVVIGIFVGGVMMTVIAPIYNLITQINSR